MFGYDRLVGKTVLSLASLFIVYYFCWVILLTFVNEDSHIRSYFLDPFIAVIVPVYIFVSLLLTTFGFLIYSMVKDS